MKIAVWSPTPFAGRKSTHLLLLVLMTIMVEKSEQLVIHTDSEGSGAEHFLLSGNHRNRMMEQKEFGVEFLCRSLHCERFSKELAINSSYTFAEGKLHVLPGGSRRFYEERDATAEVCDMIRYADEVFQNVWIELPAGESELSNHILSDADCVIINLTQSPCELAKINKLPRFKKEFYIVGAYEQRNIYAIHNMMLLYPRLRGKCAMIPYHKGFFAACCMGDAESFWMRQMNRENTYASLSFFRAVEKVYMKWKEGWCDDLCGEKEEKTWKDPNLKLLFK